MGTSPAEVNMTDNTTPGLPFFVTFTPTLSSNVTLNVTSGSDIYAFNKRAQVVFELILFTLIVVGNVAVLLAIGLSKRGQRSRMNFFILHLAIADLSAGLFSVLPWTIWKLTKEWYAGDAMCKIMRFSQSTVTYASTYVLVSMTIDRLDAIARPLSFSGSAFRAKILILLAWVFSCAFSLPMVFINKEKVIIDGTTQCIINFPKPWHWQVYLTLIAIVLFIIPAVIIAVCYFIIIYIIWSKSSYMSAPSDKRNNHLRKFTSKSNGGKDGEAEIIHTGSDSASSSRGVIPQAKIRTVKMTLVIVLVFIICWSPFFIFDLLDVYGYIPQSPYKVAINVFIQSLAPLNSVANPVIYGIFSSRICQNLRKVGSKNPRLRHTYTTTQTVLGKAKNDNGLCHNINGNKRQRNSRL